MLEKLFNKLKNSFSRKNKEPEYEPDIIYVKVPSISTRKKNHPILSKKKHQHHTVSSKKSLAEIENELIEKYSSFLNDFGNNVEQKRAVVSESPRILLLAGAGSGKTKVLTKRFVHLVKNNAVDKNNILAVTFTNEAKKEMAERIAKDLGLKPEALNDNVKTFHAFCLKLLRQDEQFELLNAHNQLVILKNIMSELMNDSKISEAAYEYIRDNKFDDVKKKEFAVWSKQSTTDEWAKNPPFKSKPDSFGNAKIKTLKGVPVRSKSERDIANFLTKMDIPWEYEKETNWSDSPFRPDFTLSENVFIEHWCYNENTPEIPQINKKKYLDHRKWKESQFEKYGKKLISIEEKEMLDLQKLQTRLRSEIEKEMGIQLKTVEMKDLVNVSDEYKVAFEQFVLDLVSILNLAKSRMMTVNDLQKKIKESEKRKVQLFFQVLIPLISEYEKYLSTTDFGKKDFNDLIMHAIQLLENNSEVRNYYQKRLKHLLIDEYQDVSFGEVTLIKLLLGKENNLFAVGDDWQSIYGWRGSEVSYILNFDEDFGEYEKIILPTNYRSTKNIVDASTHFIQLDGALHRKNISASENNVVLNEKVHQVNCDTDYGAAKYIMKVIQNEKLKPNQVMILHRSRKNSIKMREHFKLHNFEIPVKSIHSVKGKEADVVFVVGLKGGQYGFPYVCADKDVKKAIFDIPLADREAEERRLFYVAMTRAKKKLFLISEKGNESEFVRNVPDIYKSITG